MQCGREQICWRLRILIYLMLRADDTSFMHIILLMCRKYRNQYLKLKEVKVMTIYFDVPSINTAKMLTLDPMRYVLGLGSIWRYSSFKAHYRSAIRIMLWRIIKNKTSRNKRKGNRRKDQHICIEMMEIRGEKLAIDEITTGHFKLSYMQGKTWMLVFWRWICY